MQELDAEPRAVRVHRVDDPPQPLDLLVAPQAREGHGAVQRALLDHVGAGDDQPEPGLRPLLVVGDGLVAEDALRRGRRPTSGRWARTRCGSGSSCCGAATPRTGADRPQPTCQPPRAPRSAKPRAPAPPRQPSHSEGSALPSARAPAYAPPTSGAVDSEVFAAPQGRTPPGPLADAAGDLCRELAVDRVSVASTGDDHFTIVAHAGRGILAAGTTLPLVTSTQILAAARGTTWSCGDFRREPTWAEPTDRLMLALGLPLRLLGAAARRPRPRARRRLGVVPAPAAARRTGGSPPSPARRRC